jgi:hypothetical protein
LATCVIVATLATWASLSSCVKVTFG